MFRPLIFALALVFALSAQANTNPELYELRVYTLRFGKPAEVLHKYLQNALIPALNRQGVENIGAFEELGDDMPKKIYLLIAYPDINAYTGSTMELEKDSTYRAASREYKETSPEDFPIDRFESSLSLAASGFPKLTKPNAPSTVFELRTYEGYNEDAVRRKVKMFNESEFAIFDEVGLHTVFFGENIAGAGMPSLTYLLAFKDMEERNTNWEKFGPHPEWQRIVKMEEYANTVSNIDRVFLKPLPYSQL